MVFFIATQCPKGFTQHKGRCYLYEHQYRKTWYDAMRDCMSHAEGGLHFNLVSVHNDEEDKFITNMISEEVPNIGVPDVTDPRLPWIGLHEDPGKSGKSWNASTSNWVDGSPVVYQNWANNEPNAGVSVYIFKDFI